MTGPSESAAPRAVGAGGGSRFRGDEATVLRGYARDEDARAYAAKTRKGPLRRLSAARERALLLGLLRHLPRGARILDVPCGAGRMLGPLAASGHRPVGADLSAPMLAEARAAGAPLVRASALALPFRRDAFAGLACVRLLHHYDRPARIAILRELARVSAGRVVVTVFDAGSFKHRRRRRKDRRRGRASMRSGVGLRAFREELREAGVQPRRTRRLLPGYAELTFVAGDAVR